MHRHTHALQALWQPNAPAPQTPPPMGFLNVQHQKHFYQVCTLESLSQESAAEEVSDR